MSASGSEIKALVSLLDDPDPEVLTVVEGYLTGKGYPVIPELEKAWENTTNSVVQGRIEELISGIQFGLVKSNLSTWIETGAESILEGAVHLARFQYPGLQLEEINREIEKIRRDVWIEINNKLTALEKVRIINYILFDVYNYKRNNQNFYQPQNSYINRVVETRMGNPVSLSVVYMAVASKLNLPVYGVNLPKTFILAYKDEYRQLDSYNEANEILFYINPYNKGMVMGRGEIEYFIQQQQLQNRKEYYTICSNIDIMVRLMNNLFFSYDHSGHTDKAMRIKELMQYVQKAGQLNQNKD